MQQQQQQPDNDFEKIQPKRSRSVASLLREVFDLLGDLVEDYIDLMIAIMLLILKVFAILFVHKWQTWKKILRWAYAVLLVLCVAYQAWGYITTGFTWHLLIALLDYVALILVIWAWKRK